MAVKPYDEILSRAQTELTAEEQARLAAELAQSSGRQNGVRRSITELRGLGKAAWAGIDPDAYIAKERDSWGG